jgi:hypothetical protein
VTLTYNVKKYRNDITDLGIYCQEVYEWHHYDLGL